MTKKPPPNGNGRDRMPGPWKMVATLMGLLLAVALGWAARLENATSATAAAIQTVQASVNTENKERAESQRKTDVQLEGLKGDLKQIQKDVERVEKGQSQIREDVNKVLDELRGRRRIP